MPEFSSEQIDPDAKPLNFDPIPAGKYPAMIVNSDVKATKTGDMDQIILQWQITEGEFEGRMVFDRISVPHPGKSVASLDDGKQKAIQIGQGRFASLRAALGIGVPKATEEMHDIPCVIAVKVKPAQGEYQAGNEVNGYYPRDGAALAAPPATAEPEKPKADAKKSGVPWGRKNNLRHDSSGVEPYAPGGLRDAVARCHKTVGCFTYGPM